VARYLVTGGCGFIGSHLADALIAAGHQVRILDNLSTGRSDNAPRQAEVIIGDIVAASAVRAAMSGTDGCFHLAAVASVERSVQDWAGTHAVNLTGAIHVLDAARTAGQGGRPVPVVYASSAAVYGDNPDLPLGEGAATRPLSAYGADKLGCELHANVAAVVHGVSSTGLRFFNIFGPRQDPRSPYSGVISIFADRILQRRTVVIHGDGQQVRDFVYVADCVAHQIAAMARLRAAPAPEAKVYNVCTGRPTSVADLARLLGEVVGVRPEVRHGAPRAGDIRASLGSPDVARRELGLAAETSVRVGLQKLVRALEAGRRAELGAPAL
jgi:UDP-glucose 4-epimerase